MHDTVLSILRTHIHGNITDHVQNVLVKCGMVVHANLLDIKCLSPPILSSPPQHRTWYPTRCARGPRLSLITVCVVRAHMYDITKNTYIEDSLRIDSNMPFYLCSMQELGLVESVRCRDAMGCGKVGDIGLLVNPRAVWRDLSDHFSGGTATEFQGRLPEKTVLQDRGIGWQLLPFWTSSLFLYLFLACWFCHVETGWQVGGSWCIRVPRNCEFWALLVPRPSARNSCSLESSGIDPAF